MVVRAISTTAGALRAWPAPGRWTYDDYARLPDDGFRYEVIEGELYMSPAPRTVHQRVSRRLLVQLDAYATDTGTGEAFAAPCDVRLGRGTVVQPDLFFVTTERRGIVGELCVDGAPDLVVEILSPGDTDHDRVRKHALYAQHGVREYWIVDPPARTIDVFVLEGMVFAEALRARPGATVRSAVLTGFAVAVDAVLPPGG